MRSVLASQPCAVNQKLDSSRCAPWVMALAAGDEQVQQSVRAAGDTWAAKVCCRWLKVEKSGTAKSSVAITWMLATITAVCRNGRPKSTFTISQN